MGDNGILGCHLSHNRLNQSSSSASTSHSHVVSRLSPQRRVLDNGIVLLITPNPTADIVAARLFFKAGMIQETPQHWGLSHLVASVITKGTEQYSAQEIAQVVESAGASLGTDSAPDYFLLSFKAVSEDFGNILALAAEILRSPTFPERELETERSVTMQAIRARKEQPLSTALRPLRAAIHGEHPYAQTSYGTLDTIEAIAPPVLHQFHQSYFRPDQMVISIAGNITLDQAQEQVEASFGTWANGAPLNPNPPPQRPSKPRHIQVLTQVQNTQQTIVALGYPAVSVHHPDYLGLKFLMTYLCNGMSSRLFSELREKQGLAYEVSGFYPTRQDTTHFVTYLGTTPENAERAFTQMRGELERLADGTITEDDLAIAKRKWTGQYALGKQTNSQIAQIYGWYEILGLGYHYDQSFLSAMQAFPLAEVHRIAQDHFAYPICSVVGPAESIQFTETLPS